MIALLLLAALLAPSRAAQCEVKPSQQSFDLSRFMGKWYFVKEATTMWHSSDQYKCNQLDFSLQPSGDVRSDFTVFNTTSNKYETFTRTIRKETPGSTEGRLRVYRDGASGTGTMYNVLETDYVNYAVVWMCRENSETGAVKEMPYVISRFGALSPENEAKTKALLPKATYRSTDQLNCPART
ncbi:apolipoprotein D-like [Bacillus rossius redtenbacheri]|uniref:apolipoprotein D-like n=1 Tax=Bacillus rossius redtenbacheri TaxID=93214 RepID=UPI002FDCE19C